MVAFYAPDDNVPITKKKLEFQIFKDFLDLFLFHSVSSKS